MTVLQTAGLLKKRGHRVTILCPADSTLEKKAKEKNITSVNFSFKRLRAILSSDNYETIHTHLSHDLWKIVPALRFPSRSARLFLTKHIASGVSKKDILHRLLYSRVNKIIAVSEFIKKNVLETCPIDETKILVIPDAVSLTEFNPESDSRNSVKKELGIEGDDFIIGMIGRMTPGKGHEDYLSAARRIKDNSELLVKFLIAGKASYGEEKYESELKSLTYKFGLSDDVIFTGFREDVNRILSAIDILAFPSNEESFGITLIEAMAMKVPVVASNNAGVTDVIINGKTGILIPPKDPVSLANALTGLLEKPELRKKLGEEGRKRVEVNFNIDKTIEVLEKVYEKGL